MANVISQLAPGSVSGTPFTIYTSATRTADPDTQEFEAMGARYSALYVIIDMTAVTALQDVTFKVQGVDRVSSKTWDVLSSGALDAVATTVLQIGPGITATANVDEDSYVPPIFRIGATHSGAGDFDYSVGAMLVP